MTRRDRDRLAAEYALGTLAASERAAAERLRRDDPGFDSAVADWERRLNPLAEAVPEVRPPAALRDRIELALAARAAAGKRGAFVPPHIASLKRRLVLWRTATIAAVAASLILGAMLLGHVGLPGGGTGEERYVAMLRSEVGDTGFVVTVEPGSRRVIVRNLGASPPPDKDYELWIMMAEGAEPLGLVRRDGSMSMPLPRTVRTALLDSDAKLVVCVEQQGGRPPGQTGMGPIVYEGVLLRQTP